MFYGIVILLVYLVYLVFAPFLVPLAWAAVLVVVSYPAYEWLARRWGPVTAAIVSTRGRHADSDRAHAACDDRVRPAGHGRRAIDSTPGRERPFRLGERSVGQVSGHVSRCGLGRSGDIAATLRRAGRWIRRRAPRHHPQEHGRFRVSSRRHHSRDVLSLSRRRLDGRAAARGAAFRAGAIATACSATRAS